MYFTGGCPNGASAINYHHGGPHRFISGTTLQPQQHGNSYSFDLQPQQSHYHGANTAEHFSTGTITIIPSSVQKSSGNGHLGCSIFLI